MEAIKEQLSKENSKIEESGKVIEITEPPSNKDIGTNENGGVLFSFEK